MFLKPLWVTTQAIVTTAGGIAGYLFGGIDGLIIALVAFVTADYLTGVMAAISEKRLSSAIGFKGIFRKIIIFTLVGLAMSSTCTFSGIPGCCGRRRSFSTSPTKASACWRTPPASACRCLRGFVKPWI